MNLILVSDIAILATCGMVVWYLLRRLKCDHALSALLGDTIESIPHGVLFFDGGEKLIRTNWAATNLIPVLADKQAPLKSFDEFLDFVFAHKSSVRLERQVVDPLRHDFREVLDYNGKTCLMQATQFPSGETAVFLTDISEIKNKETQLYQAQKLESLGQLAGGVAHDFNNVLAIIDGYTRMAEKHVGEDDKELKNCVERIKLASKRGSSLTRQLLMFGRHKIVGEGVIELARLMRDQESLLEPLLDSTIVMKIDMDKGLFVECAADGMAQIIMNLVVNARDAMPDGGMITLEARRCTSQALANIVPDHARECDYVRLSVTDTGIGMDRETIDRMFDPFFTTKEQGKGTGLGLSLVYGLVKDMKGYVDVYSAPGEGTSIRLYLPLSQKRDLKVITETDENVAGISFEGYTVLVAEDEPDLLALMTQNLESLGMEVIAAENGGDALLKQDEYQGDIDFLLTDVVMPQLNGAKLAELFQAVREETKVIFMSGFPANGTLARIELPDDAVLLAKPVAIEKLAMVMKAMIADEDPDMGEADIQVWQAVNA